MVSVCSSLATKESLYKMINGFRESLLDSAMAGRGLWWAEIRVPVAGGKRGRVETSLRKYAIDILNK